MQQLTLVKLKNFENIYGFSETSNETKRKTFPREFERKKTLD